MTPVTPLLTVDVVIEFIDRPGRPIVLIERKCPPPGVGAAGWFCQCRRDPRGGGMPRGRGGDWPGTAAHGVARLLFRSVPRCARPQRVRGIHREAQGVPLAADDAKAVGVFAPENLPSLLAFDHARILRDYLNYRERGVLPGPW